MGLFGFLKNKPGVKIEMRGSERGEDVPASEYEQQTDWKENLALQLNISDHIKPIEDNMVAAAVELKKKQHVDDEILLLETLIESYNDIENKCKVLGPEYVNYFEKSWATVRANKPDGPSYVLRYKERLSYVKEHYVELKEAERRYEANSVDLSNRVWGYLQESQPVLQSKIYKSFDQSVKNDIREMLYFWEKQGKINREKSGNSYIVTTK